MFHVYWPMCAFVTIFIVVGVIMALLKWGPRCMPLRHTTWPEDNTRYWQHKTYSQHVPRESQHAFAYESDLQAFNA